MSRFILLLLFSVFISACGSDSDSPDSDGDGVIDKEDVFPLDSRESVDSDGDGVGDNADVFPLDSRESVDSDGDGVGDNADAFPLDSRESVDSDGDSVGDNADAFPNDADRYIIIAPSLEEITGFTPESVHYGSRSIELSGGIQNVNELGTWSVSITKNGTAIPVTLDGVLAKSPVELEDNINEFVVTLSNEEGSVEKSFSINYPFVSLSSFQSAEVVIGHDDFNDTSNSTTASTFRFPYGNAFVHSNVLYLPDYGNERVLGFNSVPSENGASADFVLGQSAFDEANREGDGTLILGGPQNMQVYNDKFFMLGFNSMRLMAFDSVPLETGPLTPSYVVGQLTVDTSDSACSASVISNPESFIIAGDKLVITDTSNDRVLIWNEVPQTSGIAADIVLGFDNMECQVNGESELTLSSPSGVWSDGTKLLIADSSNNRLLVWNTFPSSNQQAPDSIIGSTLLTGDTDASSEAETTELNNPYHLHSNGNQLFLSDTRNHRVLVWNTLPTEADQQPDVVLGQSNLLNTAANDDDQDGNTDQASARVLSFPSGAYSYDNKLFITDLGNHRYLIFNGQ